MRKFFEKLASAGKRLMRWLKGTPPARFISRCYSEAVVATARTVLPFCYKAGSRRSRFFGSKAGYLMLDVCWAVGLVPITAGIMAWKGLRGGAKLVARPVTFVARGVLTGTAYLWAVLSVAASFVLSAYWWLCHTIAIFEFRAAVRLWCWITNRSPRAFIRRHLRYVPFREYSAHFNAAFVWVHAGAAQLFRRAIGDKPTWHVVQYSTDMVAHLHGPTYDYWFGERLPYEVPVDGGETYALFVTDGDEDEDEPISEKDRTENWFLSSGYVLIATDAPDKSDKDVFNEYVRERWANLNAAEIATDEFGRTWVVPFQREPLFKDVATSTEEPRPFADQEIEWMRVEDRLQRSHSFGRHWAASLADQAEEFLTDPEVAKKERAMCYSKLKGRDDLLIEHVMKGFDAFLAEYHRYPRLAEAEPTQ